MNFAYDGVTFLLEPMKDKIWNIECFMKFICFIYTK